MEDLTEEHKHLVRREVKLLVGGIEHSVVNVFVERQSLTQSEILEVEGFNTASSGVTPSPLQAYPGVLV